ncbi:hypothetical protein C8R43DRAFT_950980 [Mycena crocata]|nr:hypothetical protein C8R43DRAFT_950980 [Mycena crocata]
MSETAIPEGTKKRRLRGACDICRVQKSDSAKMPGKICSNCVAFNSDCTHEGKGSRRRFSNSVRKRKVVPPEPVAEPVGITSGGRVLETAKSVVDGLLRETYQAPQDRDALLQLLLHIARYTRQLEHDLESRSPSARTNSEGISPKADDGDAAGIVLDIQKLPKQLQWVTPDTSDGRFFGKNSSMMFVKAAFEARPTDAVTTPALHSRRTEYWTTWPWDVHPEPRPLQKFPPPDLLRDLVNIFNFILHRPTFEKSIAEDLHLRDHKFGDIVLAVCALASKNSPDERVLLPGQGELCAGWKWFRQIQRPFSGHNERRTLYDLQISCLFILFQQTISDIESCWLIIGISLLHGQDVGAHKRAYLSESAIEAEQSVRSSLFLGVYDAICSACFGRPRVSKGIGCDLGVGKPMVCDDEYWENSDIEKAFKQPPGKPSLFEYNISYIFLINTFTFAWRPSHEHEDYTGQKPLEPETIEELDERLGIWAKKIPEHRMRCLLLLIITNSPLVLWNPYMEDDTFFDQSAVQILIHRPGLQSAPTSASAFKSLAICANAARSAAHVADVKSRRGFLPTALFLKSIFESAIVLVLNISGGARYGLSIDTDRELVHVYKCMALLRSVERRLQIAGRFNDILCELLNASNLPLPVLASDGFLDRSTANANNPVPTVEPESSIFSLPMGADDLGRLPIYDSLDSGGMDFLDESIADFPQVNADRTGPVDALLNMGHSADAGADVYSASNGPAAETYADLGDVEMSGYLWAAFYLRAQIHTTHILIGLIGFHIGRAHPRWYRASRRCKILRRRIDDHALSKATPDNFPHKSQTVGP